MPRPIYSTPARMRELLAPPARFCVISPLAVAGELAQLVERLVRNEKVRGSNPLFSTLCLLYTDPVAHWVPFMDNKAVERNSKEEWLPPWTRLEHDARYAFAATLVAGKRVVDCACGSGIGSIQFASSGATEVRAIDSSEDAVLEAKAMAGQRPNLVISRGDATSIDLPSDFADVFISLETIEHLQNDAALVDEAYRILKPGGVFVCSTPNREMTNPGTSITDRPWNEFHVREYDLNEFRACLERKLIVESIHGQNPAKRWRVALGRRLAALFGTGIAIKINKALKCRWFVFPSPQHHAVRPADERYEYEFYVLIGRVPANKS